jgi:exonuclease SbcC
MSSLVKNDSAEIKGKLSAYPERDWNAAIFMLRKNKKEHDEEMVLLENELVGLREEAQKVQLELSNFSETDLVSESEINEKQQEVNKLSEKTDEVQIRLEACNNKINDIQNKIDKIEEVKTRFPIEEIRERKQVYNDLEKQLTSLAHQHDSAKQVLKNQKKSVKLLDDVPCGDSFPTCKFIKESHKNKKLIVEQQDIVANFSKDLRAMKRSFKKLEEEDLGEKIQKYEQLMSRLSAFNVNLTRKQSEKEVLERDFRDLTENLEKSIKSLDNMRMRSSSEDVSDVAKNLNENLKEMLSVIQQKDARRISLAELKGNIDSQIKKLQSERDDYSKLKRIWKIYDFLMKAWSKKGLPTQIIKSQLPAINNEIEKILNGVVDFTVKLETDPESNSAEIYLDYGDSRRIIELASGMEKMISSLAIRVALLNVSSLPKTDMLIIDEGFGSLDEAQVAACNSLLVSLKKWFRNILVITHVDSVKDIVDNTLEISSKGKDSHVEYV